MRHLRAYRNTKSFRLAISALPVLVIVAGCSSPSQQASDQAEAPTGPPIVNLPYDDTVVAGDLALIKDGRRLSVGDPRSNPLRVFKSPSGSYEIRSLPSVFGEKFSVVAWESNDRSFGAILYTRDETDPEFHDEPDSPRVVQAMITRDGVDDQIIVDTFMEYRDRFGPPDWRSVGEDVAYWIWEKRDRVLMINKATEASGTVSLTVAVGVKEVMDRLRMSESAAKRDAETAEELLKSAEPTGQ